MAKNRLEDVGQIQKCIYPFHWRPPEADCIAVDMVVQRPDGRRRLSDYNDDDDNDDVI